MRCEGIAELVGQYCQRFVPLDFCGRQFLNAQGGHLVRSPELGHVKVTAPALRHGSLPTEQRMRFACAHALHLVATALFQTLIGEVGPPSTTIAPQRSMRKAPNGGQE